SIAEGRSGKIILFCDTFSRPRGTRREPIPIYRRAPSRTKEDSMKRHALALSALLAGLFLLAAPSFADDKDQEKFIANIKKIRGKTDVGKKKGGPVTGITLAGTKATDATLKGIDVFPDLLKLDLNSTKIGDAGLEHIKKLTKLRELRLTGLPITDAGL